jgi:DNA-binding Xre family transcriptional regulator
MGKITTKGRITIMLGQRQAATGERLSPRRLAQLADVPKDMVYRLDAGQARYVDLGALARLCDTLDCRADDILVWESGERGGDNGRSG